MLIAAAVGVPVVLYLAFVVFGVQTLFIDNKVDEAAPQFDSGASSAEPAPTEVTPTEVTPTEAASTEVTQPEDPAPTGVVAEESTDESAPSEQEAGEVAGEAEQDAAGAGDEIVVLAAGNFVDRSHPSSGVAEILNDGSAQRFLRFEDFETDNGPDLFVYLTTADATADASEFGREGEFVDLGVLKGNIGSQNYEIPEDVDIAEFNTVVIWCRRFAVAFGAADLS